MDNGTRVESAAFYNLTDNTFRPFHIAESPLCSGHALLPDGSALIGGGKAPVTSHCIHHGPAIM